ncbi:MAG: hypothetical protein ACT4O5_12555 [Gammaproteobacteria bacterium]
MRFSFGAAEIEVRGRLGRNRIARGCPGVTRFHADDVHRRPCHGSGERLICAFAFAESQLLEKLTLEPFVFGDAAVGRMTQTAQTSQSAQTARVRTLRAALAIL